MADHTNVNGLLFPVTYGYLKAGIRRLKTTAIIVILALQQPAPQFPHKPFSLATALILGFLQVTTPAKIPLLDSNPALYYAAVTSFLTCNLTYGFEITASSHPVYPMSAAASNALRRCMFLAGSVSFAATAAFLFPEPVRAAVFALNFFTSSGFAMMYWVCQRFIGRCIDRGLGWCVLFVRDKWRRVAYGSLENQCATTAVAAAGGYA